MKKFLKNPYSVIKWFLVFLSVANLIFLFVFNYRIPSFLRFRKTEQIVSNDDALISKADQLQTPDTSSTLSIQVPEDPLYYDSSQTLNLMDGVSLVDSSGAVRTDIRLFSVIKATNKPREKTIEYSATDETGYRTTAQRKLILDESYIGPIIELSGEMPSLSSEDLPVLVSLLSTKGQIHAEDGFGNDVTSAITAEIASPADESGNTLVTLTITNMVNDFYTMNVSIFTGTTAGPRMELTTNAVTLQSGERFNFYNYIESAVGMNGEDLHHRIDVEGSVNTNIPGVYTIDFYCTDEEGNRSNKETLTVTVQ